jgi:hypothetical protein
MSSMKLHNKQALVCSVSVTVVAVVLLFAFLGAPATADGASESIGRLLGLTLVAGILCAWMAGKSAVAWSWLKFAGIYLATCIALLVLSAYGKTSQSHAASAPAAFSVHWPKGWTVQHLEGISSDPADHDLGSRERGLLGDVKAPRAVIELSCIEKKAGEVNLSDQIGGILTGMTKGYSEQGFKVSTTKTTPTRLGNYDGLSAVLDAVRADGELMQNFSIAQSPACVFTLTLTAKKVEYDKNLMAYADVKASVR